MAESVVAELRADIAQFRTEMQSALQSVQDFGRGSSRALNDLDSQSNRTTSSLKDISSVARAVRTEFGQVQTVAKAIRSEFGQVRTAVDNGAKALGGLGAQSGRAATSLRDISSVASALSSTLGQTRNSAQVAAQALNDLGTGANASRASLQNTHRAAQLVGTGFSQLRAFGQTTIQMFGSIVSSSDRVRASFDTAKRVTDTLGRSFTDIRSRGQTAITSFRNLITSSTALQTVFRGTNTAIGAVGSALSRIREFARNAVQSFRNLGAAADDSKKSFAKTQQATTSFGAALSQLKGIIIAWGGARLVKETLELGAAFNSVRQTLNIVAGDAKSGADAFNFIREQSQRLGTSLLAGAKSFATFINAARGTRLEGEGVRKIYKALSETTVALGLSNEQFGRIMTATGQIMTKGRVQTEELLQLTEAGIPIYAELRKALNLTGEELADALKKGQVPAEALLKVADLLSDRFKNDLSAATKTTVVQFNALREETRFLLGEIGGGILQSEELAKVMGELREAVTQFIDSLDRAEIALFVDEIIKFGKALTFIPEILGLADEAAAKWTEQTARSVAQSKFMPPIIKQVADAIANLQGSMKGAGEEAEDTSGGLKGMTDRLNEVRRALDNYVNGSAKASAANQLTADQLRDLKRIGSEVQENISRTAALRKKFSEDQEQQAQQAIRSDKAQTVSLEFRYKRFIELDNDLLKAIEKSEKKRLELGEARYKRFVEIDNQLVKSAEESEKKRLEAGERRYKRFIEIDDQLIDSMKKLEKEEAESLKRRQQLQEEAVKQGQELFSNASDNLSQVLERVFEDDAIGAISAFFKFATDGIGDLSNLFGTLSKQFQGTSRTFAGMNSGQLASASTTLGTAGNVVGALGTGASLGAGVSGALGQAGLSGPASGAIGGALGGAVAGAGTAASLALAGAVAGSVVPIVGTIVGAALGAILGAVGGGLFSKKPVTFAEGIRTTPGVPAVGELSDASFRRTAFGVISFIEDSAKGIAGFANLQAIKDIDDTIARALTPAQIAQASAALQGPSGELKGIDFGNAAGPVIAERIGTVIQAVLGGTEGAAVAQRFQEINPRGTPEELLQMAGEIFGIIDLINKAAQAGQPALTQYEQQVKTVNETFAAATNTALDYGFNLETLEQAQQKVIAALKAEVDARNALDLLSLTDPYQAQVNAVKELNSQVLRDTIAVGGDIEQANKANAIRLARAIAQRDQAYREEAALDVQRTQALRDEVKERGASQAELNALGQQIIQEEKSARDALLNEARNVTQQLGNAAFLSLGQLAEVQTEQLRAAEELGLSERQLQAIREQQRLQIESLNAQLTGDTQALQQAQQQGAAAWQEFTGIQTTATARTTELAMAQLDSAIQTNNLTTAQIQAADMANQLATAEVGAAGSAQALTGAQTQATQSATQLAAAEMGAAHSANVLTGAQTRTAGATETLSQAQERAIPAAAGLTSAINTMGGAMTAAAAQVQAAAAQARGAAVAAQQAASKQAAAAATARSAGAQTSFMTAQSSGTPRSSGGSSSGSRGSTSTIENLIRSGAGASTKTGILLTRNSPLAARRVVLPRSQLTTRLANPAARFSQFATVPQASRSTSAARPQELIVSATNARAQRFGKDPYTVARELAAKTASLQKQEQKRAEREAKAARDKAEQEARESRDREQRRAKQAQQRAERQAKEAQARAERDARRAEEEQRKEQLRDLMDRVKLERLRLSDPRKAEFEQLRQQQAEEIKQAKELRASEKQLKEIRALHQEQIEDLQKRQREEAEAARAEFKLTLLGITDPFGAAMQRMEQDLRRFKEMQEQGFISQSSFDHLARLVKVTTQVDLALGALGGRAQPVDQLADAYQSFLLAGQSLPQPIAQFRGEMLALSEDFIKLIDSAKILGLDTKRLEQSYLNQADVIRNNLKEAIDQQLASQLQGIASIDERLRALKIDETLPGNVRLDEARKQFHEALQGTDAQAVLSAEGQFRDIARQQYASSPAFFNISGNIEKALQDFRNREQQRVDNERSRLEKTAEWQLSILAAQTNSLSTLNAMRLDSDKVVAGLDQLINIAWRTGQQNADNLAHLKRLTQILSKR